MKERDYSEDKLMPSEYYQFIRKSELVNSKNVCGSFVLNALYKTHEYIICNELRKNKISKMEYENGIKDIQSAEYYDISVSLLNGGTDPLKKEDSSGLSTDKKIQYLAFESYKDIYLVSGSDTIACSLCHFEPSYNTLPYVTFVCSFNNEKHSSFDMDRELIFNDKIFSKRVNRFLFKKDNILKLPKLKLS